MSKITRVFQNIFAVNAPNTQRFGNGQFGSGKLGTKVITQDIATLQSLTAYTNGWEDSVIINGAGQPTLPPLPEDQALHYIETYQLAYMFQEGVPEYDATTVYYANSVVKQPGTFNLYGSLTDSNSGNALTDIVNWTFLRSLQADIGVIMGFESSPSGRRLVFNGQTMAKTSGGTVNGSQYIRAYEYLWNNISNTYAPVSSGRGLTADADFAANKNITLPDFTNMSPMQVGSIVNSTGRNNIGASTVTSTGAISVTVASHTLSAAEVPALTISTTTAHPTDTTMPDCLGAGLQSNGFVGSFSGITSNAGGGAHGHSGSSGTYTGNATSVVHPVFGLYYYINY